MLKLLFSVFLMLNSVFGYLFYEDTAFGDYLADLSLFGQLVFVCLNFIVSHLINLTLNSPLATLSVVGLFLLVAGIGLAVGLWVPYWILFSLFGLSDMHIFPWVIYFFGVIAILGVVLRPMISIALDFLIELNEKFWEGLKANAIQSALNKAKKNSRLG